MPSERAIRWVAKPIVFVAGLLPAVYLVRAAFTGGLGADPLREITHQTGDWALRFIVITLAITPVRRLIRWSDLIRFRRMAGLYGFFYATLHFLIYVIADRFAGLDFPDGIFALSTARALLSSIWEDIYLRPYITVGFTAFVAMIPLALTSTAGWIRRLGGQTWRRLHRLIYVSAVAAVVHYWWLVKADVSKPAVYATLVALLLGCRVAWSLKKLQARRQTIGAATPVA